MSIPLFLQHIYWREPLWLLLSLQPLCFVLLKIILQKNSTSLYAAIKLHPWVVFPGNFSFSKQLFSKNNAYILAWILFSVALAGPRTALTQLNYNNSINSNIMLVVDYSRSMMATDIMPNRIKRAEIEINELLSAARSHRVGITVFSARPHLFVPLTTDHKALKSYLESLDKLVFPTTGSDYVSALLFAQNELKNLPGKSAIILLTDGDLTSATADQISLIKQANIPLYILGIGSVEGEAIQLHDGRWLNYNGKDVISRMNEDNLTKLASLLNGKYSAVSDTNSDWQIIYNEGIAKYVPEENSLSKEDIIWNELFPYFLLPALCLFIFSLSTIKFKYTGNISLFFIALSLSYLAPAKEANAFDLGLNNEQRAYRAYKKSEYKKSEYFYKTTDKYNSYYGQASSLYKLGHYHEATKLFILAIINAENDQQRVQALYSLGNCRFRTGDFSQAIKTYNDVLYYQPMHYASIHNLKISRILKKSIEQQTKEQEKILLPPRQGRGPRSSNISEQTDISDNTSVSVSENKNKPIILLPELPGIDEKIIKKLILSGLNKIKLAEQATTIINNKAGDTRHTASGKTYIKLNTISDSQHLLWKRLFEIEEGFPAPVKEAKTLPGFKPW